MTLESLDYTTRTVVIRAIIGLIVAYIVSCIGTAIYNIYWHPLAKYPGPQSRAAFHLPDALSKVRGTSYTDSKILHDQYGTVVRIRPNELSYNSAQAWKDIYGLKPDRSELAKDLVFYKPGRSIHILSANQREHARIRKMLAPAFSDRALLEQEPLLTFYFELLVTKLKQHIDGPSHGRVDLTAYYNFVTFDIIGDLVLGEPFGALEGGEYHDWIRNIFQSIKILAKIRFAMTYPAIGVLFGVIAKFMPSLTRQRKQHMLFTKERIDERLDRRTDRKDFVTQIFRDENGKNGLTHDEILGNSRILLTAGSETTATHLTGATWLLLMQPDALTRAQAEVRAAFKTADDITLRSVNNPGLLPYLEAVIQESLRCYPSVPATLPRTTGARGAPIDGSYVPANTTVGVHHWSAYRSADNFTAPDKFIPERWLPDAPREFIDDNKEALQPFHIGPRVCLGKSLAYFEIRSIMTRMLWHFDMELDPKSQNWLSGQKEYTLWDKPPLWVRLERRSD